MCVMPPCGENALDHLFPGETLRCRAQGSVWRGARAQQAHDGHGREYHHSTHAKMCTLATQSNAPRSARTRLQALGPGQRRQSAYLNLNLNYSRGTRAARIFARWCALLPPSCATVRARCQLSGKARQVERETAARCATPPGGSGYVELYCVRVRAQRFGDPQHVGELAPVPRRLKLELLLRVQRAQQPRVLHGRRALE